MDIEQILGGVLRGSLSSGRSRRHGRTLRYLTGGSGSFINASTILTAAGVAWGMYESMRPKTTVTQASNPGALPGALPSALSGALPRALPAALLGNVPPALPGSPSDPASGQLPAPALGSTHSVPPPLLRMIRIAISAARADGTLTDRERASILQQPRAAGLPGADAAFVEAELRNPLPLAGIVAGVSDPNEKAELYTLAFAIARADETVGGAERIYLAQLGHLLGLDSEATARIEAETAAKIDSQPGA